MANELLPGAKNKDKFIFGTPTAPSPDVVTVQGTAADGAATPANAVLLGADAENPDALPAALTAGKLAKLVADLSRRLIIYQGTQLDPSNDGVGAARAYSPGGIAIPTTGAGYVAGDVIGGIISLTTVNFSTGRPIRLKGLQINDKGGTTPAMNIYFFPTTPTGGTYADNGALVWGAADRALVCGQLSVLAADYKTDVAQSGVCYSGLNIPLDVGATTLFALLIATAAGPITITNGNLSLRPRWEQD